MKCLCIKDIFFFKIKENDFDVNSTENFKYQSGGIYECFMDKDKHFGEFYSVKNGRNQYNFFIDNGELSELRPAHYFFDYFQLIE